MLNKIITGSAETDIGKFISYLENSDWIKQGLTYKSKANDKCPYCQQTVPVNLYQDINAFFDEAYEKDIEDLKQFNERYEQYTSSLLVKLDSNLSNRISILDYQLYSAAIDNLKSIIENNTRIIKEKILSPSTVVNIKAFN